MQLVRAALKRGDKGKLVNWFEERSPIALPNIRSIKHFSKAEIAAKVNDFNQLHDWHEAALHPCFAQFLGLKQTIEALLDKASPFPLMGLVHVHNQISVIKPLQFDELSIECWFDAIQIHPKGITVDVNIKVKQANEICQCAKSTYLYRIMSDSKELQSGSVKARLGNDIEKGKQLSFDNLAGRKYARISGDYNPIHLYHWSAKLLGFKTAIAHGMHTLALTLSHIDKQHKVFDAGCIISNDFINPASLPCNLTLSISPVVEDNNDSLDFELSNPAVVSRKQLVLSGCIEQR